MELRISPSSLRCSLFGCCTAAFNHARGHCRSLRPGLIPYFVGYHNADEGERKEEIP